MLLTRDASSPGSLRGRERPSPGTDWSLVPYSVIVGRLRAVDDTSITLGGGVRILVPAGVTLPEGATIGTSLTVTAVSRDGVLYAEKIVPALEVFKPHPEH